MTSPDTAVRPALREGWADEVQDMLEDGATAKQIAERFSVSLGTAYAWRRKFGVRFQSPEWKTEENRQWAEKMFAEGASIDQVAKTLGATWDSIKKWFPEQPSWSKAEAAELGRAVVDTNKLLKKQIGR